MKSAYEETVLQLEEVRRENSRLRRWSCSPLLRRPRPLWSRRRTRCKKQIEEAEEIAALNLVKYRKVAGALGDAAAAADAAEQVSNV